MTVTSSSVKNRYNAKTYERITVSVRKEKAKAYKVKCVEKGISFSEPLHNAIDQFLEEK